MGFMVFIGVNDIERDKPRCPNWPISLPSPPLHSSPSCAAVAGPGRALVCCSSVSVLCVSSVSVCVCVCMYIYMYVYVCICM
jgi:hypothetical protein